ncbi:MAG: transposase [Syntrophales bacterium]|jgi:putative transposase|nr:transposase [Syntrophales bacterium]
MTRHARQALPDIPYHIVNRGNNHQKIFFDGDDYYFFFNAIKSAKEQYPCKIYSFAFMTNHIHLLIEPVESGHNLASFIKQVSQRHGQYINKRYERTGTLWEGRFKSSPISTDAYLLACCRYIEMNPVRAGLTDRPEDYKYSSYRSKIGIRNCNVLDSDPLYESFGSTSTERQQKYRQWFQESVEIEEWDHIRYAIKRNWPYGNDGFKKKLEDTMGYTFEIKKAGRKPENKY